MKVSFRPLAILMIARVLRYAGPGNRSLINPLSTQVRCCC